MPVTRFAKQKLEIIKKPGKKVKQEISSATLEEKKLVR